MGLALRARQVIALGAVVLLVVAASAVAHLASVARIALGAAAEEGELLARQLYHQSSQVVAGSPEPSLALLQRDSGIRALLEGIVGYSPIVVYAAIVDPSDRVVAHSDKKLEGQVLPPRETLELCVLGLLAEGHLIIEDFPGVGKTSLAKALARSIDCAFSRLQFTPDLLPSDVTGVNVFNQRSNEFEFRPGPVFANILLVDEINRASPKTQAALLECMQERQVTVDGVSYLLPPPFMVMATQNPIEYEGTYPLPEAELDRFTMRIAIGYPPLAEEAKMLSVQATDQPLDRLESVASAEELMEAIDDTRRVFVEESINRYVVTLLRQTRSDSRLYLGASPRAGIALMRVAKARAIVSGRDYVEPDDVKTVAPTVLAHRLILAPEARSSGLDAEDLVRSVLERTPVPV